MLCNQHRKYDLLQRAENNWELYQLDSNGDREKSLGYFANPQDAQGWLETYDQQRCEMDYVERVLGHPDHPDTLTVRGKQSLQELEEAYPPGSVHSRRLVRGEWCEDSEVIHEKFEE